MKRKQLCKKMAAVILTAAIIFTEGSVMAGDFSDDMSLETVQEDVNQEDTVVTEEPEEKNTDKQEEVEVEDETDVDFSDTEEQYDEAELSTEQEDDTDVADFELAEEQETPAESVGVDEDNLLGGDTVIEASTSEWKYIYNSTGAALTEYLGEDGKVTVPANIDGKKVIACKKDLLHKIKAEVTSVVIEAEFTSLPDSFFSGLESLETVELPDTITDMGNKTFYDCGKLKSVKLPANLKKIRAWAFRYCIRLEEIKIPDKVTEIVEYAFGGCSSLKNVQLPSGLKKIGFNVFDSCEAMKEITIPEGVEKIEFGAFNNCTGLESIELPDSIKTVYNEYGSIRDYGLANSVFANCNSLKSVKLPKNLEYISYRMFEGCSSLKTIEIPSGVTGIGDSAFADCSSLSKIKLPDKVTEIGANAFKDCIQLVSAYIPSSVTKIGENTFIGCSLLTIYGTADSYVETYAAENGLLFSTEEMPDTEFTTETEGSWTFLTDGTSAIITEYTGTETALMIPKTVNGLKVIALKKDLLRKTKTEITSVVIEAELTSLPDNFFSGLESLETVELPDTITDMGNNTFYDCGNLKRVKLPANLEKIRAWAFRYCIRLEEIKIPDKVTEIVEYAFGGCSSLKNVQLPSGLKKIGFNVFDSCEAMKEITIPEGVEKIEFGAFNNCTGLESIELPDSIKTVYNEYGSIRDYGLANSVFANCNSLKSVKLPKNLEYISYRMFEGCSSLKTIEIPSGVTGIGDSAFADCSSLSKIKLPDKVTEIGTNAFKDCLVLTNLTVYSSMKTFGEGIFTGDPFLVLSCVNNSEAVDYAKNNGILYTTVEIKDSEKKYSAEITKDTLEQMKEGQKLAIDAGNISLVFDADAVKAIKNAGVESDITLSVKELEKGETGNGAQDAVIDKFINNEGKVLNLALTDKKDNKVEFNRNDAGTFSITIPYTIPDEETPSVFCIYEDGRLEKVQSSYDTKAKTITFITPHFSVFAIGSEKLASEVPIITPQPTIAPELSVTPTPTVEPVVSPSATPTPTVEPIVSPSATPTSTVTPVPPTNKPENSDSNARKPVTYIVDNCTATGLDKPLKFSPGVYYNFRAIGAGEDNKSPIKGDEKYVPVYWSLSPGGMAQNTIWKIGTAKGIANAGSYCMYIFFQKYTYDGAVWKKTGSEERQMFTFYAAENPDLYVPKLNLTSLTLKKGQSTTAVKVKNVSRSFKVKKWYSKNKSIAKVNRSGKITAGKKTGTTVITVVMSNGKKATIKVKVQKQAVKTKGLSGLSGRITIKKGKTARLKPVRKPVTSLEKITYSSSNKKVATVSSKGVIKGRRKGKTVITVKSGKVKKKVTVVVK